MKYKTTSRAVRGGYRRIISLGYCQAQALLRGRYPVAYTVGVYGWNYDVYDIGDIAPGVAICTGYRGMPGEPVDYQAWHDAEGRAMGNPAIADAELRAVVARTLDASEKGKHE